MQPDPHLLKDCRRGDRKAQYLLFRACFPVLQSVCVRYAPDDAQAQAGLNEAFLRIVDNLKRYRSEVPFEAWIKRIAINIMIDAFRKNRRVRELIEYRDMSVAQPDLEEVQTPFDSEAAIEAEVLQDMIRQLPPLSRKVFNLYAIDGYTHREVAQMLGMQEGTSKWHVSSARKKLQDMVREYLQSRQTTHKIY